MRNDRFEWDDAKAASNWRKHRVSFEAACEALDDLNGIDDLDDDPDEERWQRIGMSSVGLLVVISTDRGHRIRIISAREASNHESLRYHRQALPEE